MLTENLSWEAIYFNYYLIIVIYYFILIFYYLNGKTKLINVQILILLNIENMILIENFIVLFLLVLSSITFPYKSIKFIKKENNHKLLIVICLMSSIILLIYINFNQIYS